MDFPVRWTLRVLALAALIALGGLVYAQALPTAVNITPVSAGPSGLSTVVTYDARGVSGAANAGYYSRPVLVSNTTLAGLGRGALRRALPVAAMVAIVEAAGWAIDELSKQVMSGPPPETPAPVPPGGTYYTYGSGVFSSESAAMAHIKSVYEYPGAPHTVHRHTPADQGDTLYFCVHHQAWAASDHYSLGTFLRRYNSTSSPYSPPVWSDPVAQPSPVSDAALADAIKANPQVWNDLLRNADGSVNRNPDVQAGAQALADALSTGPAPSPTEEWDTGNQGGTPQPSAGGDFELPGFCDWATVVCDFITWAQDDDTPPDEGPIEVSEWTPTDSYNSGLGNGSCPADVPIAISNATFSFSYGPFCTLAGYLRPLVIALAYITAGFILIGASRRG